MKTTLAGLTLSLLFTIGIAASASALPDLSITLGGAYPLRTEITLLTLRTKLSSTTTKGVTGEGILLLASSNQLTALGTGEALFTKVENKEGLKCSTSGDSAGEILTSGSIGLVYTSLSPLTLGILYEPKEVTVTCGEEKVKVKGTVLSSINAAAAGTESTELTEEGGVLTGNEKGVPTLKSFWNYSGEASTAKLESNFGTGFVQAALEVGEVKLKASEGKMFVITGR